YAKICYLCQKFPLQALSRSCIVIKLVNFTQVAAGLCPWKTSTTCPRAPVQIHQALVDVRCLRGLVNHKTLSDKLRYAPVCWCGCSHQRSIALATDVVRRGSPAGTVQGACVHWQGSATLAYLVPSCGPHTLMRQLP